MNAERIVVLSGGVGAARLLRGFHRRSDNLTAIVNVGDDMVLHGLHISADIDTIIYTLSDAVSAERGWGLDGETWNAMEMLGQLGGENWFNLGDKDLATHMFRTQRLSEGASLTDATRELVDAWGLDLAVLPVTNDALRTMVTIDEPDGPTEVSFQHYFVALQHGVPVSGIRFAGADTASLSPEVRQAVVNADRIIIAPSNPLVSIDPLLAVPGMRDLLVERRDQVVAVSPIVGGTALKGPAARLMTERGLECSAVGVARHYVDLCGTLVIDTVDASLAPEVEALGIQCVVTDTIMAEPGVLDALCTTLLG